MIESLRLLPQCPFPQFLTHSYLGESWKTVQEVYFGRVCESLVWNIL